MVTEKGVKLTYNTIDEAMRAVNEQGIKWEYCHQPLLPYTRYRYCAGTEYSDHKPGLFYYFVNCNGDEVACWFIPFGTVQFFETPRKVDRNYFPDGKRIYKSKQNESTNAISQ